MFTIWKIQNYVIYFVVVWSAIQQVVASHGCHHPGRPLHSVMLESKTMNKHQRYEVGTTVTYTCQRGYELVQNEPRNCQQNGTWSGVQSICAKNVALGAIKIIASDKNIVLPDNIHDGFYNTCSALHPTKENVPYYTWMIELPMAVNVTAIKLAFMHPESSVPEFTISYKTSATSAEMVMFDSTAIKGRLVNVQSRRVWESTSIVDKLKAVTASEVKVQMNRPANSFDRSLCEVAIYSSSDASDDLCTDEKNFPTGQFVKASLNNRCFYMALNASMETNFEEAIVACRDKNAVIATVDSGRLKYLSKHISKMGYTRFALWVAEESDTDHQTETGCQNDCCPAMTSENEEVAEPAQCDQKYGYLCETELQSCGNADQNEKSHVTYLTPSKVKYTCPKRFQLNGDEQRDCVDGKWTGYAPICGGGHSDFHTDTKSNQSSTASKSNSFSVLSFLYLLLGFVISTIAKTYM